jgi:hypothetical protein
LVVDGPGALQLPGALSMQYLGKVRCTIREVQCTVGEVSEWMAGCAAGNADGL